VVALVVYGLQFARRFGEEEGSPIRHTADNAVLFKDDFASGFGNSKKKYMSDRSVQKPKRGEVGSTPLLREGISRTL
jgi:hypothetical protein